MLGFSSPYPPMEALSVDEIPVGDNWQYEPKWDGFRCLAFRDRQKVELQSKSGQPLARYFPELVEALLQLKAERFVLDGEIIVPVGKSLSFDQLLQRLHPAESRVRKLSVEYPATLVVFDLLVGADGDRLVNLNLRERRKQLERLAKAQFHKSPRIELSPMTTDLRTAKKWFASAGSSLDGVIAKRRDVPYLAGERDGMVKVKPVQTVDCVVGGFRYATAGKVVGSLLLGLFAEDGLLHHVGFTSSFKAADRAAMTPKLEKLIKPPGFTGSAPGAPSRWSTKRSTEWQPLSTKLVVEVNYDHFTGGRFRHGAKFLRWRPDKNPKQCTFAQLRSGGETLLRLLRNGKPVKKSTSVRPNGARQPAQAKSARTSASS